MSLIQLPYGKGAIDPFRVEFVAYHKNTEDFKNLGQPVHVLIVTWKDHMKPDSQILCDSEEQAKEIITFITKASRHPSPVSVKRGPRPR